MNDNNELILFNFFMFIIIECKYFIYKRKLCAMIYFYLKYNYISHKLDLNL